MATNAHHLAALRAQPADLARYLYLRKLQANDAAAFYKLLIAHASEVMPFVYTPTVGEACQKYSHLPIKTVGLYITANDRGRVLEKLRTFRPKGPTRVVVVTDGERILGLGDLGAGGMGISEGKILLYTVVAGVDPAECLPVCLDVGTNNKALLADPKYLGLKQPRLQGQAYEALVDEFFAALKAWQPHTLVQFEDFANTNAFRLLDTFRHRHCAFNDDIQGTASITLAGVLAALRLTGGSLPQQRFLFLGAGEAGTGIAELIALALVKRHGLSLEEARRTCCFMDSKGLVCASRLSGLQHHKRPFAHDLPHTASLAEAIRMLKPTALIGVSTIPSAFTREVVQLMAELNDRPIIFPLSNPTSKSECTYQQAMQWTDGRVVFASGSPFAPLAYTNGSGATKEYFPAQANNAYIFPSMGYAAVLTNCYAITDEVFIVAAEALATMSTQAELDAGRLFPVFDRIREVSAKLTAACADFMCKEGLGAAPPDCRGAWEPYVRARMFTGDELRLRARL